MTTRHFYSSAEGLVLKSLRGSILLNPSLKLHPTSHTIYTTDRADDVRVAVISGGGAGHEPAYAGYTGRGMLTACVSGEIFASPSSKQILNTIRLAAFGEGSTSSSNTKRDILVVINNYTGDRLNFGLAIEKARVLFPDISLSSVVVADDVSLLDSPTTQAVGPRGLAGNILVCKVLGALAHKGAELDVIKAYGDAVCANLASIGVALEHCHVPGRGDAPKPLEIDECEIGLGLHNEAGVYRKKMEGQVRGIISEMVHMLLERGFNCDEGSSSFLEGVEDETVLFVNNLGGVSQLEMGALLADLTAELGARNVRTQRIYSSSYMTSLNASGFSASLVNVSKINSIMKSQNITVDTYELLDAPTEAHSWLGVRRYWGIQPSTPDARENKEDYFPAQAIETTRSTTMMTALPPIAKALASACQAVLKIEKELTDYDTVLGDGDCGHTFAAGALAVLSDLQKKDSPLLGQSAASATERVAGILEDTMGGTIGALFGIYLNAYSLALQSVSSPSGLYSAPMKALEVLENYTTAKPGDRTVIDALHPFCKTLATSSDLDQAVIKAITGAQTTKGMTPKLGRAAYVGKSERSGDVLDPGAWGVAKLLEGFAEGLRSAEIT